MAKVFIYKLLKGNVSVSYPTDEALELMTLEQIATKDTPLGRPFWIVENDDLPHGEGFFDAWELDDDALGEPDGYGANPELKQ